MTMLALVYHGPEDLRLERRAVPSIGPGEMLLQVEAASVCATDLRIIQGGHRKYPPGTIRIPGHEMVGALAGIGRNATGYRLGERVFVAPNVGCGQCPQCLAGRNNLCPDYEAFGITMDGAFAEFMRISEAAIRQGNVIPLRSEGDPAGLALAEPLACVLRGQEGVQVKERDVVLILGAGPIGIMHLLLARRRGARRVLVIDQSAPRLAKAAELGAGRVIDFARENAAEAVRRETGGEGADVVIVATAARDAVESSVGLAAVRGRISLFAGLPREHSAISLDTNLIHYKELVVTGSTGCSTGDCRRAVELVVSGAIDLRPLISGQFPLREAAAALEAARDSQGLKVVLRPAAGGRSDEEAIR